MEAYILHVSARLVLFKIRWAIAIVIRRLHDNFQNFSCILLEMCSSCCL